MSALKRIQKSHVFMLYKYKFKVLRNEIQQQQQHSSHGQMGISKYILNSIVLRKNNNL